MKPNQSVQFTLLAAISSLILPATCIHVQNTTQSSSTAWSNPETATTLSSFSELPSSSPPSSTTAKPTTTARPIPFGMIIRESGAITLTWRRCGEGLSSSSAGTTTSSRSTETVTDLEVFPTVIPDPEPPNSTATPTTLTDLEIFPTILPDPTETVTDLKVFPTTVDDTTSSSSSSDVASDTGAVAHRSS